MAARNLAAGQPAGDGLDLIIACAIRTLEEPSARMAYRFDWSFPSLPGKGLVGAAVRALWRRSGIGDTFSHGASEGFAEPAAGRYMIDSGELAEVGIDGTTFFGRSGCSLAGRVASELGDALWLLRLLPGATEAALEGTETLRGTACRKFAVRVDTARAAAASRVILRHPRGASPKQDPSLALTVWIDGKHVRQVFFRDRGHNNDARTGPGAAVSKDLTLGLWDFGVPTEDLDWSRLPSFQPAH